MITDDIASYCPCECHDTGAKKGAEKRVCVMCALSHTNRALLVGEANPLHVDQAFALWPEPSGSSGWRLCHRVFKISRTQYLGRFDRVNLCTTEWIDRQGRERAQDILELRRTSVILLGAKVARSFGIGFKPFSAVGWDADGHSTTLYTLPHPSGLCREWSDPASFTRARELLAEVLR